MGSQFDIGQIREGKKLGRSPHSKTLEIFDDI